MDRRRKPGMTARERAFYEQQRRKQAHERKLRRAQKRKYINGVIMLGLIASAFFAAVIILLVMWDFSRAPEKYEYSLEVSDNGERVSLSNGITVKNNTCYVSLSDLSEYMDFKMIGDVNVMSAMFNNGDAMSVYVGSDVIRFNDIPVQTGAVSYFSASNGDVLIPVTALRNAFEGVVLEAEKSGKKIDYRLSIADGLYCLYSGNNTFEPFNKESVDTSTPPKHEFTADLSAYEKYMDPENADEYITLINTEHPLGENYIPQDLVDIADTRSDRKAVQMREYAAKALEAMFIEMRAAGYTDVSVTSAYRSYDYQQQLFNNSFNSFMQSYDRDTAYAKTAAQIAIPGTSEHQSGLCADLHNLSAASQVFEYEDVYKWLVEHCADFGFILRFPKDKTDITGIIFEPWHYRYVGRYHAQKIMESGLCLEEYCELNGLGT